MMKVLNSGDPPSLHIVKMLQDPDELVGPAGPYPDDVDYYKTSWDDLELNGERAIETIVMESVSLRIPKDLCQKTSGIRKHVETLLTSFW